MKNLTRGQMIGLVEAARRVRADPATPSRHITTLDAAIEKLEEGINTRTRHLKKREIRTLEMQEK